MTYSSGHARDPDPASVLDVIRGTTRSWEQDPRPYATADEEQLRSILVSALNGAFLGRATAESFNGRGKVDITVRSGSDNVFLAECKFYNGPNSIRDAADQLLSYSGWRDRDLCLLIFVRSAAMTAALAAVPTAVERSGVIERLEPVAQTGPRCCFTVPLPMIRTDLDHARSGRALVAGCANESRLERNC